MTYLLDLFDLLSVATGLKQDLPNHGSEKVVLFQEARKRRRVQRIFHLFAMLSIGVVLQRIPPPRTPEPVPVDIKYRTKSPQNPSHCEILVQQMKKG